MRIVDAHSHLFSRPFFEALAAASPLGGSVEEKLEGLARSAGLELPPADLPTHLARWIDELDAKGVEHLVTFASLPQEVGAVAEAVALADGRLSALALVDPGAEGAAARVAELLDGGGFRGILTFPAMHHVHLGDAACRGVLEVLDERGALCTVHCGILVVKLRDLMGLPRPYDLAHANPLALIPAANAAPRAHFVIPHFGAGFLREALMVGVQCPNVYLDTSSTHSWIRTDPGGIALRDVFARALDVYGVERILFGTDSSVFPAGWRRERYEEQRGILEELGLSRADQERIFAHNANRLLGRG